MANDVTIHVKAKDDASKTMGAVGKSAKGMGVAAGAAALAIGGTLVKALSDSVKEAQESVKVHNQTVAVLKSTGGAANVTAKSVEKLATAISNKTGIDDEAIQSGENLLLTFRGIRNETGKGNDIFNQATMAITDMSVAMGQDMKTSAIQVGKALNDPIKGMTALQRVGVTFTDKQKATIKRLEETGHHLEAQKIILGELRKEFGGSAKAAATWADKAKVAGDNVKEAFGKALLPSLEKVSKYFVKHQDDVAAYATNLGDAAQEVGKLAGALDKLGKGPLDRLMRSGKTGKKMGGGIGEFADELVNLKQKALRALDPIAQAFAKVGLVSKKNAAAIHQMRIDADGELGKLKKKFIATQEAIQQREIKAKVRADIKDLESKIKTAKKRLRETNDQKTQAKIKAEIRDLQAKVRAAKAALKSIPKTTNTSVVFHAVGYGGVMAKVRAAKGAAMIRLKVPKASGGIVGGAASGGVRDGLTLVGENGPELVDLPSGSHVNSNPDSMRMMSQRGGGGSVHITINAPNVTDRDGLRRMLVDMQRRGQLDVIRR